MDHQDPNLLVVQLCTKHGKLEMRTTFFRKLLLRYSLSRVPVTEGLRYFSRNIKGTVRKAIETIKEKD